MRLVLQEDRSTVYVYQGDGVSAASLRMLNATLHRTCDLQKHRIRLISPREVIEGTRTQMFLLIARSISSMWRSNTKFHKIKMIF